MNYLDTILFAVILSLGFGFFLSEHQKNDKKY